MMDTVFSSEKAITYSYYNPGAGKGYTEQVLKAREMHTINGKCYEFYYILCLISFMIIRFFVLNKGSVLIALCCHVSQIERKAKIRNRN